MTDHASPIWVRNRDGQIVPFEADRICQSLFAATEASGRPDAFLARELTDGVVHFLTEDIHGSTPGTDELPELVAKVVRELGQPALARQFEELSHRPLPAATSAPFPDEWRQLVDNPPPSDILSYVFTPEKLIDFSLSDVFPKNLVAAHRDGLLTLWGLDHPLELTGSVLGPGPGLFESLRSASEHTGGLVAIDAPEFALSNVPRDPSALATEYVRELKTGLRATGLTAVVNLNAQTPPTWDRELGDGPLFAEVRQLPDPNRVAAVADALGEEVLTASHGPDPADNLAIAWHLSGPDFAKERKDRLQHVARFAADGLPITFHLDRPRRPVSLATGLSRSHSAMLLAVGVYLPRLAEQVSAVTPDLFLQKLGTLARLARSAGHAKQDFLRQRSRPAVTRGFLLDRARLVVVPVGLDAVVRSLTGGRICDGGSGEEFARQILMRLRAALAQEKPRTMDAGLDSAPRLTHHCPSGTTKSNKIEGVTGLTAWDSDATAQQQLRASGALQAVAEGGTATVLTADAGGETIAGLLKFAWTQTEAVRVRFVRPA